MESEELTASKTLNYKRKRPKGVKVLKQEHKEEAQVLENHPPAPEAPVVAEPPAKTVGRKPNIVKDFNKDPRSLDMAIYIQQGLTVEEAAILAKISPEEQTYLKEKSDSYRRWVQLQIIKFKQKHLQVLSDKENPSTSQYMLENRFPDEYGKKAKQQTDTVGSTQIIQAIVKSVQVEEDPLVKVHEHDDEKKANNKSAPQITGGHQPSLEPGGANII